MSQPEDFFPLYLTISEFDIDRGPVIRAQLPSPIPIVTTFLSPTLRFPAPMPAPPSSPPAPPAPSLPVPDWKNDGGDGDDDQESNSVHPSATGEKEAPPPLPVVEQHQRPENHHQYISDQMLPDGSDRNMRNTSWMLLNRPMDHDSGVLCCVFQMSATARWQPRAALLAVLDGVLTVVDMFELVKHAPSFSLPRATIDPQAYLPIGPMTKQSGGCGISLQELGALPADKMSQITDIFAQPPLRPKSESTSLFDAISGVADLDNNNSNNTNKKDPSSSSSSAAGASMAPKAFAYIRGESCSAGIAFSSVSDLERVRSWIQTAAAPTVSSSSSSSTTSCSSSKDIDADVSRRCLYGAVVSVTKKMPNARRGSVNFSVCVCSAELRWLTALQHFLEIVAIACCDATALSTPDLISKQIAAIADSAYSHVVSKILPVAAGMGAGAEITRETALCAVARRLVLHDDSAWVGLQCVTEPWAVPPLNGIDEKKDDDDVDDDDKKATSISSSGSNELATAMLPSHALPPAPLQPVIAATGTSSAQSLSAEHCAGAHLSSLIGIISEAGFCRLLAHVLLQRRVLVISRGGGGSRAAQMVMAIGSLFNYFDDFFYAKRAMPYASVSLLDVVVATDGILAGTVNPLFETKFGKTGKSGGVDVLVDLDQRVLAVAESVGGVGKKESISNRDAPGTASEFQGSELLARWTDDFARELHTSLQRKQAAAMSSGGAMLQRNEESSIIEDVLRLSVVRELSILMWRMSRAGAGVPRRCAESRVYLCGRWLGRGRPEAAVFGEHITRLLLPLDERAFLDESMIVSFLQHGVRLATSWSAAECISVVATSPRALQCLSALCCHASSVVRLLSSILLQKLREAHPVIESCLATQVNMFLHFSVDAAQHEFKAHAK